MVEGTGLENRRCESIRGFESHSLRQINIDLQKYPRGRRGSPAKGVGWIKPARGFKSLLLRQIKASAIWLVPLFSSGGDLNFCRNSPVGCCTASAHVGGFLYFRPMGENADKSLLLRQRITVILIQRNDGYFISKISFLRTFGGKTLLPLH